MTKAIPSLFRTILLIALCIYNFSSHAQAPLIKKWDHRFGGTQSDFISCIKQTSDSGFILGGYSNSGIGGNKSEPCWGVSDYWIVKTNSLGVYQWDKRFGGNSNEQLNSIAQTKDQGFILGGYTASDDTDDISQPSFGYNDYWILKTDSLGNKLWDKRFGGTTVNQLKSVQQTTDGGFILGGWSNSGIGGSNTQAGRGLADFWVIKTDSLGNQLWDKRFGGSSDDQLISLQQTSDGGYILGGWSNSGISGDKTQALTGGTWADYWIVKIDSSGIKMWDKAFGGLNGDYLSSIEQTTDGGYILGGRSSSGQGGDKTQPSFGQSDYWIVKTDSLGNFLWDQTFGGNDMEDELGNVLQTSDNGYLVSGTSYSQINGNKSENNPAIEQVWVIKTNSTGIIQWDKTIFTNGHDEAGFALQTFDGCFVMANYGPAGIGGYRTEPNQGSDDYWIVKFCDTLIHSPNANIVANITQFCEKHCINFTDISTNNPTSWQWYFPGSDTPISTSQNPTHICYNDTGSFDVTLIACNAAGCDTTYFPSYIHEYAIPTPNITFLNDTFYASPGISYQWFSTNTGTIPGATNHFYVPVSSGGYYVKVTDNAGCMGTSNVLLFTGIFDLNSSETFLLYPNPNFGKFEIEINEQLKNFNYEIYDELGKKIEFNSSINNNKIEITLTDFHPGIYVFKSSYLNRNYIKTFLVF